MTTEPNDFAFSKITPDGDTNQNGLTKREYFAAMAMQALINISPKTTYSAGQDVGKALAEGACIAADELIKALNKQP